MKWVVLLFCLITTGVSMAQTCVPEGAWMANNTPRPVCCAGLELNSRPQGSPGFPGQCLRKVDNKLCMGENITYSGFHGREADCCSGLSKEQVFFEFPTYRCVKKAACTPEGQYLSLHPQHQSQCCEGLEPFRDPNDRRIGAGPQCVRRGSANCVTEGSPLFQYPGAPTCCPGLTAGRPSVQSPVGFADVCLRGNSRPQVNNTEAIKELSPGPSWLTEDPGPAVSNQ